MTIIQLLLIAWLPGAVLFRLPWFDRDRRARLDPEERLFWAVILSLAWSLTGVLAMAALDRYAFGRLLWVNVALAAGAAAIFRRGLLLRPERHVSLSMILPLALAVLCAWRFFPPSEYIIGGKDPGTYFNEGVQIAQRGSLVIRDPEVAALPGFARDMFFPRHRRADGTPRTDYYGVRFMGFRILDPDRGEVVGQFPHLLPASMAIGYGLDGLTGVRRTTPVWALLGILSVYFATTRLFGRRVAGVAAALLALNVLEVWFARYPNSEVVMQTLVFAALLAHARAQVDEDRFFAPVAAVLLGLALFLRFDAILAVGAIAAGSLLHVAAGRRMSWGFVLPLAVACAAAGVYLAGPMRAYATYPLEYIQNLHGWQQAAVVLVVLAAVAVAAAAPRFPSARARMQALAPPALGAAIAALGIYALFFRHPAGKLAMHDAYALRTFANFYVTVPVMITALAGYALMSARKFWRDTALFVTVAIFGLFFFYKIRIVPEHFWMARRFVPVVLPGVLIFASAAAFGLSPAKWRWKVVRGILATIFIGLIGAEYVRASRPVMAHTEYAGLIPRVEALAARFGDNDLVLVESRDAGGDVHVLGLPLAYIYGRHVLELPSARPDKAALERFLQWARSRYARVFFVGGGGTDLLSYRYSLRPVASDRFRVPEYQSEANTYPRGARGKDFEFGIYEVGDPVTRSDVWFDLDIGANDDLHVLRFRAKEVTEGRTFRWTGAQSYVSVTAIQPASRELTLTLADGGRPPAAPDARVDVYLHNQLLGSIVVDGPFRPYTFAIPPALAERAAAAPDPVELRLVTTTWKPADVLGTPDDRDLGVMLDRVTIR